jgi:hypothetical protein
MRPLWTATSIFAAAAVAVFSPAVGQVQKDKLAPPVQGSPGGAVPPCPSISEQQATLGEKTKDGIAAAPANPVEGSIILPSTGGDARSGAPSAQQNGEALRSPVDCPLAPGHPNAMIPNGPPLAVENK